MPSDCSESMCQGFRDARGFRLIRPHAGQAYPSLTLQLSGDSDKFFTPSMTRSRYITHLCETSRIRSGPAWYAPSYYPRGKQIYQECHHTQNHPRTRNVQGRLARRRCIYLGKGLGDRKRRQSQAAHLATIYNIMHGFWCGPLQHVGE